MSRTLTGPVDTALVQPNVTLITLVDLDFISGSLYLCTAPYDFHWNGNEYIGTAKVLSMDAIGESIGLQMQGIRMQMACTPELVAIALAEPYSGRPMRTRLALLNNHHLIIADPIITFQGRIDTMRGRIDHGQGMIWLTAESPLTDWNTAPNWRFNHEDQFSRFPGDMFFEYVPQMVEKQLLWGVPSNTVPSQANPVSSPVSESSGGDAAAANRSYEDALAANANAGG